MALAKCKECGNEISTKADKCPNCGAPTKINIGCGGAIGIIIVVLIFVGVIGSLVGRDSTTKKTIRSSSPQKTVYRQVGPIEDVSFARIKRVSARIVIPPGFSRHELESILRDAAVDIGRRERASATMIFAYRSQDVGKSIGRTPWTVGRAVYAPNGRWEDAGENGPMKVSIELGEVYFRKAPTSIPKRGDEVLLFAKYKKSVEVSRLRDAWGEANIVAKVPSGTKAHVVERYEEAFTSTDIFVRYLVKTNVQGKAVQGWVWGFQVKEIAATFEQRKLVKQVQEQLIAEGFDPGPADGIFGLQTKKALRSYQAKHGLSLTGKLDGTTLKALGLSDHK